MVVAERVMASRVDNRRIDEEGDGLDGNGDGGRSSPPLPRYEQAFGVGVGNVDLVCVPL